MKDDDFKLLRDFGDGRTDGQTFMIIESFLRLKYALYSKDRPMSHDIMVLAIA